MPRIHDSIWHFPSPPRKRKSGFKYALEAFSTTGYAAKRLITLTQSRFLRVMICSECISFLALLHENVFPFPAVHLKSIPWDFYLILIVLGTLVPWRGAVRVERLLRQPVLAARERLSLYTSTIVYQWLIVAVVAWRAFSRNLGREELGLTAFDPWRIAWIAVFLTALLCANQWLSLRRMMQAPETRRGLLFRIAEQIMPHTPAEIALFLPLHALRDYRKSSSIADLRSRCSPACL